MTFGESHPQGPIFGSCQWENEVVIHGFIGTVSNSQTRPSCWWFHHLSIEGGPLWWWKTHGWRMLKVARTWNTRILSYIIIYVWYFFCKFDAHLGSCSVQIDEAPSSVCLQSDWPNLECHTDSDTQRGLHETSKRGLHWAWKFMKMDSSPKKL